MMLFFFFVFFETDLFVLIVLVVSNWVKNTETNPNKPKQTICGGPRGRYCLE
jgi:hypothetical protein